MVGYAASCFLVLLASGASSVDNNSLWHVGDGATVMEVGPIHFTQSGGTTVMAVVEVVAIDGVVVFAAADVGWK